LTKWRLNYKGKGCGGANIPFASIAEARAYAKSVYALTYSIETDDYRPIEDGTRPTCRHNFTRTLFPNTEVDV